MVPKLEKFPRSQRFLIGDRIESTMLDILDLLIDAAYSKTKSNILRQANLKLEKLRYLIRISKDLHLISIKGYEFAARGIDGVGTSIGGWMKYARNENL